MRKIDFVLFKIAIVFVLFSTIFGRMFFQVAGKIFCAAAFEASLCFLESNIFAFVAQLDLLKIETVIGCHGRHFLPELRKITSQVIIWILFSEVIPPADKFLFISDKRKPH